jgi:hypothetical protein
MKRCHRTWSVAEQDRDTVVFSEHLDIGSNRLDQWCPDEHGVKRFIQPDDIDVGLEAGQLAAVSIAPHGDVDRREAPLIGSPIEHRLCTENHPSARTENRHAVTYALRERVEKMVGSQQMRHRRTFTSGDDECVDIVQLVDRPYRWSIDADGVQALLVNGERSLESEYADAPRRCHQPRSA